MLDYSYQIRLPLVGGTLIVEKLIAMAMLWGERSGRR